MRLQLLAVIQGLVLPQGVIAVEGLNLEALRPGLHMLHCLPLKLAGSDGAPVRCITIT